MYTFFFQLFPEEKEFIVPYERGRICFSISLSLRGVLTSFSEDGKGEREKSPRLKKYRETLVSTRAYLVSFPVLSSTMLHRAA